MTTLFEEKISKCFNHFKLQCKFHTDNAGISRPFPTEEGQEITFFLAKPWSDRLEVVFD